MSGQELLTGYLVRRTADCPLGPFLLVPDVALTFLNTEQLFTAKQTTEKMPGLQQSLISLSPFHELFQMDVSNKIDPH